jgi:hypothetical protein
MKEKYTILFALTVFVLIFISSCKNKYSPTETPQAEVLFSKDSLSVSSSDTGQLNLMDSITYEIADSNIRKIELKYLMESNGGDSSADRIYYGVFLSKPGVSYFAEYGYLFSPKTIDTTHTFDISSYPGMVLRFKVSIERKTKFGYKYVRFRNLKLTKIE